jgi:aspartate/methionine/tyrosine aminotransferase
VPNLSTLGFVNPSSPSRPFSSRTAWDLAESALSSAIRAREARGQSVLDLTVSNPTVCGFDFDAEQILDPLKNTAALVYDPDPRGLASARAAVAGYYADHGAEVDPNNVILTTSTSEAYSFLFRLLCDAGDQVLVAQPSYPLFDFLATLDDVQLQPYLLFHDFGWWIDFAELERRISPRTRAILLVHPNNPTGHATSIEERLRLEAICERHGLALIVDEVFLDYALAGPIPTFAVGPHPCLTFVVSGMSKIAALPQMKIGWLAAFGAAEPRNEALARLEVVADTFLSMNAPAQLALPRWLGGREAIERQILDRVQQNLAALDGASHLSYLPVQAGWSAVVQLPQHLGSATLAEDLVAELGLIVHPSSFYAMAGAHRVVVSLIVPAETFWRGIQSLNQWCESNKLTVGHSASTGTLSWSS